MNLTDHFTLEELMASDTAPRLGIDNTPPPGIVPNLQVLATNLELIRALLAHPLRINSGFRCPALNAAIKGSPVSDHMTGFAADFICPEFGPPIDVVHAIVASNIKFDQCIQEGTWTHLSFAPALRRQVMTAHFGPNGTQYTRGA